MQLDERVEPATERVGAGDRGRQDEKREKSRLAAAADLRTP